MVTFINNFNLLCMVLFTILYAYQGIFMFLSFFIKPKKYNTDKFKRYAVIIPARNESEVIENLIESIKNQNYPKEFLDIYLLADNCTDNTAEIGRKNSVYVYERSNNEKIGKGYALTEFFDYMNNNYGIKYYDGYFIFDADNLLEENFVVEMNKLFSNGFNIVTGYRNSKNYSDNWVSSATATWFLRDCVFMHKVRMFFSTTSNVTGTGFLISSKIIEKNCGWNYHLMTEDIEFSVDQVLKGEVIGYAHDAMFYDEQPTEFFESWKQRKRWVKGFYQVLGKYWKSLINGAFIKGDFGIYDMFMLVAPGNAFTIIVIAVNFLFFVLGLINISSSTSILYATGISMLKMIVNVILIFFIVGLLVIVSEWKRIKAKTYKKIITIFTFPFYMFTYIPISIISLFWKPRWEPIKHKNNKKISDIR